MTQVAVLTPAGTGAIATVAAVGPGAWEAVRARFRPASGKPPPDRPDANRFWFGTLGDGPGDEVVVAVKHGFNDTNRNELSKTPSEVDVGGEVATKRDRAAVGSVSSVSD